MKGTPSPGWEAVCDHRHFYVCDNIAHCASGLARDAALSVLHQHHDISILLEDKFLDAMLHFRGNPAVIGFFVEQTCLATIYLSGLFAGTGRQDFQIRPTELIAFHGKVPSFELKTSCILYVPAVYNFKAIDGLLVILDADERLVHLVPLQITIASVHDNSETKFFEDWKVWTDQFIKEGYIVHCSFVWIEQHVQEWNKSEVSEMVKRLRGKERVIQVSHRSYRLPIKMVNEGVVQRLKTLNM
jgi:hypothetical protein